MHKARKKISEMNFFEATKFIRDKYKTSMNDSIDFAKAFAKK